ncbi:MAG: RDD family protein [Candidatus Peregrinibacteria bacterium]|nr:RDD family protein [Candidatus Peregrinibacteria bacterium]
MKITRTLAALVTISPFLLPSIFYIILPHKNIFFQENGGVTLLFVVLLIVSPIFGSRLFKEAETPKKVVSLGLASFWKRFAIGVFDYIIMLFFIPIFFNLFFYFRDGQTLGDKVFGTRVISAEKNIPEVWPLIGRVFAQILSAAPSRSIVALCSVFFCHKFNAISQDK